MSALNDLVDALKTAVIGVMRSKKFVTAIATAISAAAVRAGYPGISIESIVLVISPILAAILGQGFADIGKHFSESPE